MQMSQADEDCRTVSYNSVAYLTNRYNLPDDLAKNIAGIDTLIQNALSAAKTVKRMNAD